MGFHVYIDDSGSDGPLWDIDGNFRDTAQKTLCCAALLVQDSAVSRMEDRWRDLLNDIASKLRQEMTFPGQVRVTVVRESRVTDFAK